MRFVIQRVNHAEVTINGKKGGKIDRGLMILAGIGREDTEADLQWMIRKALNMRIFEDEKGLMNLSVLDTQGEIMIVSQFTLYASTKKGNRPGFSPAAAPEQAIPLYEKLISEAENLLGRKIVTGEFGADMKINLENNGPVTIILDSKNQE